MLAGTLTPDSLLTNTIQPHPRSSIPAEAAERADSAEHADLVLEPPVVVGNELERLELEEPVGVDQNVGARDPVAQLVDILCDGEVGGHH